MSEFKMRISAKGFFFNDKGEVLLIRGEKSKNGDGYWSAPGGGVEEDENLFAAVERELTEETGFFGESEKIVLAQDYNNPDHGRNFEVFFTGHILEQTPIKPLEDENLEFRFFNEDEFAKIDFKPDGVNPFELKKTNQASYKTYL